MAVILFLVNENYRAFRIYGIFLAKVTREMIEESIAKGDLFFLHLQLNRLFQRGLGRRATFLEDGGYTGIFSAMLHWSSSGKSCEQNMELQL